MALFCLPGISPILCPNSPKNHVIQIILSSERSIPKPICFEASRISISSPANVKCRSSLNSSCELEMGDPSTAIIFIKGLARSTSDGVLKKAFSQFGEVSRVKVVTDKVTKQPLGFAYVWFTSEHHAQAAVDSMNGQFFEGRYIRVTIAKPGSCKPRPRSKPYKF